MTELDTVRELAGAALASLEANRQRIDDLNVYPVPDGDTGTNLTMSARAVVEALESSTADDRRAIAREVTRAALMGARGNSGVILSQIVRGAADVLGEGETIDAEVVARAVRAASDAAYRAVRRPVEGTMLTVIREIAEEAEAGAPAGPAIGDRLIELVRRGEDAVARTPEQLAILREAGVVDAGGAGLVEIVRGIAAAVTGQPLPEAPAELREVGFDAIHQELSRYRYCTVVLVEGEGLDADALEQELDALGDSLLVVGDPSALKVHLHTDDPGAAISAATALGVLASVEVANMHRQTEEREQRLIEVADQVETACGVVAVVAGAGNRALFESLGATYIVEGGQSMNPSVGDIAGAIEEAHERDVIVLPNNPNVLLAAEQAASSTRVIADVIPTRSVQEGLAAMVVFNPELSREENAAAMRQAIEGVVTGEVTVASRDAELDGVRVRKGNYLGLAGGEAVAEGEELEPVARAVIERLLAEPRDVLTILTGEGAPDLAPLEAEVAERHPGVELEVHAGGQPHYPLLISAE